jgi:hypothetical protein
VAICSQKFGTISEALTDSTIRCGCQYGPYNSRLTIKINGDAT